MFGVLVIDNGEDCYDSFKVFGSLEKAKGYADYVVSMGLKAKVFDYDVEAEMYLEFFDVG